MRDKRHSSVTREVPTEEHFRITLADLLSSSNATKIM